MANKFKILITAKIKDKRNKDLDDLISATTVENLKFINFFNFNDNRLDKEILNTILKYEKLNSKKILQLCLYWNKIELVNKYLFDSEANFEDDHLEAVLQKILTKCYRPDVFRSIIRKTNISKFNRFFGSEAEKQEQKSSLLVDKFSINNENKNEPKLYRYMKKYTVKFNLMYKLKLIFQNC